MIKSGEVLSPLDAIKKQFEVIYVPTGGDLTKFNGVDKVIAFISGNSTDSEAYDRNDILVNQKEFEDLQKIFLLPLVRI